MGVIVQFGGQTPLKLAVPLARAGVPILGTSPDAIDRAEDRERFNELVEEARAAPAAWYSGAQRWTQAIAGAAQSAIPVLIRPSYVLGGRAMEVIADEARPAALPRAGAAGVRGARPLLIDRYLDGAIEVDVDAICRRRDGGHRRHHGARRARRHPFGRQRLRAAAAHA